MGQATETVMGIKNYILVYITIQYNTFVVLLLVTPNACVCCLHASLSAPKWGHVDCSIYLFRLCAAGCFVERCGTYVHETSIFCPPESKLRIVRTVYTSAGATFGRKGP